MSITLSSSRRGKEVTLFLAGDIDHRCNGIFLEKIKALNLQAAQQLYVNFKDTVHIDRDGLGLMLMLLNLCQKSDTQIALVDCPKDVSKVFEYCKFDKLFEILDSSPHANNEDNVVIYNAKEL